MKNCPLASPCDGAKEAFSQRTCLGRRASLLSRTVVFLALALPIALAAQPVIEKQPQSQTVLPGATVTFSVTAVGLSLSYQWIETNSLLPSQTNSTLILTSVTTNDAGLYQVIVSNSFGAVTSSPAFLYVVTAPPSISVQPQSQSAWGGTAVAFSVDVGGTAGPLPGVSSGTLQLWLKADAGVIATNGGLVSQWQDQSGNENDAVQTDTNEQPALVYPVGLGGRAALRFKGVLNSTGGDYLYSTEDVGVPNAMTTFTVYNAFSNVIGTTDWGAVIWFVGSPEGSESSRGCAIFQGLLDFTTWDGNYSTPFIVPTNTYRICTDRVNTNLSMVDIFDTSANSETNFSYAMAGESAPPAGYYIGALNPSLASYGYSRCFDGDIAEVIIYQGYLSEPDRLAVLGYLQGKYFVSGAGGAVGYQWRFNGSNVSGATNASLILTDVQPSDEGSYSVVVTDLAGSTTSSNAALEVKLIPTILVQPTNQTVFSFQSVTFSVVAQGPVPLQYQWTFDGADISDATNSGLVLSNVPPSQVGTYAVIVGTEPNVTVSSNAVLSVYAPNEIVSNLDAGQLNTALQAGGTVTFATNGTIVLTNTITISNNVIIDGSNHSITISGGGAVELFNLPPGLSLTLRNLTLANGLQNGEYFYLGETNYGTAYGGAIYTQGTLEVENCTFTNNRASGGNGAFFYDPGSPGFGGAIFNTGWLIVTNSWFANNLADGGSGGGYIYGSGGDGLGGTIYNSEGTVELYDVWFSNNACLGGACSGAENGGGTGGGAYGGAFYSSGGSLQASNLLFLENKAYGGYGYSTTEANGPIAGGAAQGGAFYLLGTAVAVSNSVFSNNIAVGGDGAYYDAAGGMAAGGSILSTGSVLLCNCVLENSVVQGAGYSSPLPTAGYAGAIYNAGSMQIIGTTISNNSANGGSPAGFGDGADALGGAIFNTGSLTIEGTTVVANNSAGGLGGTFDGLAANGWGGAIYNSGFVQLSSTILSSNTTSGLTIFGEEIYSTGVIESDANSSLISSVVGTPPLTYQWQDNGSNIGGATNSIFNLGKVQFAAAGTYDLAISNASGLVTNIMEIVNEPPPPLTISSATPDAGFTNGGTSVTITGTGFTNGATVSFGAAAAASVTVVSATNITAYTPAVTNAGTVDVVVINGDFQPVTLTNGFTFVAPVSISSPQQGGTSGIGSNGTFTVNVGGAGLPGWSFIIESSTDLENWQPLQTNSSPFSFTDTNAARYPLRFYRAVFVR